MSAQPTGMGRMLPAWLDTRHPTSVIGTNRVRAVDREFLIGLDTRRGAFQLWGPSLSAGGWVPLQEVTDDFGRPLAPQEIQWELLTAALIKGREQGKNVAERVREHNERLAAKRDGAVRADKKERAGYFAAAVDREINGDGRFNAADVTKGYNARWV